jgi:cell division protein FtsL
MSVVWLAVGAVVLSILATMVGTSLDTASQQRARRRVAEQRRQLAVERRALHEECRRLRTNDPRA